ncbi:MAG: hypothetical protein E7372_00675 [Clostridiales bacterium]|nr:hypothetical protein [Clostridiales bacterium]
MYLSFLPNKYLISLSKIDVDFLYEIRLRTGYPIKVNYSNKNYYLSESGLTSNKIQSLICSQLDIDYVVESITERSIYAFNDRLKDGYITTSEGIRIGIAGECVFNDRKIQTIKNFSSLNIRIPHLIDGCSTKIMPFIYSRENLNSTLIISPPFLGKTTLLKDIIKNLNNLNIGSILVIDERGEFSAVKGENIDNILYSDKNYAFNYAVRSMAPKFVVTDELSTSDDWVCAKNVVNSGVKIIASAHSDSIDKLCQKSFYIKNLFDRYVVLGNDYFGQAKEIYDKDLNILCDCF